MGRSIKSRLVALFVVAVASFGIFASGAFASSPGRSYHSCVSYYVSTAGGVVNAADQPAGYQSVSYPVNVYGNSSCAP
jgi:hypothetical protein